MCECGCGDWHQNSAYSRRFRWSVYNITYLVRQEGRRRSRRPRVRAGRSGPLPLSPYLLSRAGSTTRGAGFRVAVELALTVVTLVIATIVGVGVVVAVCVHAPPSASPEPTRTSASADANVPSSSAAATGDGPFPASEGVSVGPEAAATGVQRHGVLPEALDEGHVIVCAVGLADGTRCTTAAAAAVHPPEYTPRARCASLGRVGHS